MARQRSISDCSRGKGQWLPAGERAAPIQHRLRQRAGRMGGSRSRCAPSPCPEIRTGRSGFRHDPCVIEDGGSGRKPPSVSRNSFRPSYRRRGFRRDPLRHREPGVRGCRGSFRRDPCVIEDGCSGLKPLLQKPSFCRSGFSRDLCVIENQGFGVVGAVSVVTLAPSRAESSGLKPLLHK
jgi:hypothetical protein